MTKRSRIQRLEKRLKIKAKRNKSLGIAIDPNELIKHPSFKDELKGVSKVKSVKIKSNEKRDRLENEAKREVPKKFRFGVGISKLCAYMISKHGDNYEAMERDPKNHYQRSAGAFKRMIKNFNKFKVNHNAFELATQECDRELKVSDNQLVEECDDLELSSSKNESRKKKRKHC